MSNTAKSCNWCPDVEASTAPRRMSSQPGLVGKATVGAGMDSRQVTPWHVGSRWWLMTWRWRRVSAGRRSFVQHHVVSGWTRSSPAGTAQLAFSVRTPPPGVAFRMTSWLACNSWRISWRPRSNANRPKKRSGKARNASARWRPCLCMTPLSGVLLNHALTASLTVLAVRGVVLC